MEKGFDELGSLKELKKTGKSINFTPNININKREYNPLADLEADLALGKAYCKLCERSEMGADYKKLALKYAHDSLADARNYQFNKIDFLEIAYASAIRPLIAPIIKSLELGKYRNSEEVTALFEEFKNERKVKNPIEKILGEGNFSTEFTKDMEKIIDSVSAEDKIYISYIVTNLDEFAEFLLKKGYEKLMSMPQNWKKEGISNMLREKSTEVRDYKDQSEEKIVGYMKNFIDGCAGVSTYCDECPRNRENFSLAETELDKLLERREKFYRDLREAGSWVLDLFAGLVENMTEEEYLAIKDELLGTSF